MAEICRRSLKLKKLNGVLSAVEKEASLFSRGTAGGELGIREMRRREGDVGQNRQCGRGYL